MLKDLVIRNRSYRGYDENHRITKEELLEFVDCARLCPSSVNKQPFMYRLVLEQEEVKRLQKEAKWARGLPDMQLPHKGMHPTAFIVICLDSNLGNSIARYQKDVGIVAQTMLLAAAETNLGGCMIGNFGASSVKRALNLEEHIQPMLIVAFGKPAEKIILTEIEEGESTDYYRDEKDIHYVPKRKLKDIII